MSPLQIGLIHFPLAVILVVFAFLFTHLLDRVALSPIARRALLFLVGVELTLILLNALAWQATPGFLRYFLDLDEEWTFGTMFSSLQLALIGFAALLIAWKGQLRRPTRLYLAFVAMVFGYLAADEFYSLHEKLIANQNSWPLPYWVGGGLFVAFSVAVFWLELRRQRLFVALMVVGFGLLVFGAVAVEEIFWDTLCARTTLCKEFTIFEESFELIGQTVMLAGFAVLAERTIRPGALPALRRALAGSGAAWLLSMLIVVWALPAIELQVWATPVEATFGADEVSLLGYRLSKPVLTPGDTLALTLYFRANRYLPQSDEYSLSIHAVARPAIESVAQVDDLRIGTYPSTAWLPGVVVSRTVSIPFPVGVAASRSYWLTLRLWHGNWEESWENTLGLPVTSSNRALLTSDTLLMASVPVLRGDVELPATLADFPFAAGFHLIGYALPTEMTPGVPAELRFWWQVERDVEADLTQFIHLVNENGAEVQGFDSPPFGGAFPTGDWPGGMRAVDTWTLTLPDDVPAGEYTVRTGMYAPDTLARAQVSAGNGEPLNDNSIVLGRLRVVR